MTAYAGDRAMRNLAYVRENVPEALRSDPTLLTGILRELAGKVSLGDWKHAVDAALPAAVTEPIRFPS